MENPVNNIKDPKVRDYFEAVTEKSYYVCKRKVTTEP